jgi:sugar-specific transcriptional regulator TrmB
MVTSTQPTNQTLYDQDYYLWLRTTINQLRTGQFSAVDLENLLEELETIGRNQKRTIKSLLIKLLVHLLKLKCWDSERERNQGHWQGEIRTFRREIKDELKDSPSLKPYILEIFDESYQEARKEVSDRSQLTIDKFPFVPIASLEQILDENWFQ